MPSSEVKVSGSPVSFSPVLSPARWWVAPLFSFAITLAFLCVALEVWGPNRPLDPGWGDASQYMALGRNLADGRGFKDTLSLWPDQPSYDRMPGWPVLIAVGMKLAPKSSDTAVVHYTGIICLALAAALFTSLNHQLGLRPGLSVLGGLGLAFSPAVVALVFLGLSETAFILAMVAGAVALFAGGRWRYAAALCFGFASLVRTNFILFPAILFLLLLILPGARRELRREKPRHLAALLLIMYLPALLWAARNYTLTGRILFLSSIEGETLYGSNNDMVANDLFHWGTWVMPGKILGEIPKADLARGLTDAGLNDYYHARAIEWIKTHRSEYPRLVLGKLIRGLVPIPWIPLVSSWIAFGYRFLLDVLFIGLVRWWWPATNRLYLLLLCAMFSIVLITTVIYYGNYRFTHCVELFFIPCILLGWQRAGSRSRT